jgi:hypothetical protein
MKALLASFGGDPIKLWKETGILLPIAGGAKGYNETADLLLRTVDGVPFEELYAEINATIALLNAQRAPLMAALTFPVTNPFEEVMQVISDEFEEADEFGQPKGIRLGAPWNMGYDMKYYDLGIRYTFRFLGRAPASQIRALNNSALEADQRLVMKRIMERLFDNTTWSAQIESSGTAVSVYPFYNGDITTLPAVPPAWKTFTHTNTHTHYLASGGASLVSNNLETMYDHIYHHGYTRGGTTIYALVNKQEADIIRTFRVAVAGDLYDFIPASGQPDAVFRGDLFGSLPGAPVSTPNTFPGFIGTYGPINIVQEDYVPAGYVCMFASGGAFNLANPVGLREHENAALRGLKLIPMFERYPLREAFYHHALGTGIRIPGAGVVMKVTAGSYTVPTSFALAGPGGR